MIKVTVGTNTERTTIIVEPTATPKDCFAEADVDYSTAIVHLDGSSLNAAQMNSSLYTLGITGDSCYLIAVIKTENN